MLSAPGAADAPGAIGDKDAGVTLVEMLVGMGLMLIVATLATNFLISSTAQTTRVTDQGLLGSSVRSAMNQIVATLRVADSPTAAAGATTNRFITITSTELTFYSNISPTDRSGTATRTAPSEVDYTLAGGKLTESVYAPSNSAAPATYPTTPTSKSVLLTGVTNTTPFVYCSDATDPSTTCTPTTATGSVALVQVTLTISGLTGSAPQTLQSGVAISGALS